MTYFVVRRRTDNLIYGKNYHWKTTGNKKLRHGFDKSFQPYLYSTKSRALTAIVNNQALITEDVEVLECELVIKSIKE